MENPESTMEGSEKLDGSSLESQHKATDNEIETEIEYPTKFKLIMVVVALVLAMFLVSHTLTSSPSLQTHTNDLTL